MSDEVQETVTELVAEALSGPSDGEHTVMIAGTESTVRFSQDGTFKVTIPDPTGERVVEGEVIIKTKGNDLIDRIRGWSNGGDPSDFGWVIDGVNWSCSDMQQECWQSWADVEKFLPRDIVASMRKDIGDGPYDPSFDMEIKDWFHSFD